MRFHHRLGILCLFTLGAISLHGRPHGLSTVAPDSKSVKAITGSVTGTDHKPASGALVRFSASGGTSAAIDIKTDAAGVFSIPAPPAGVYTVHAELGSLRSRDVSLTVPDSARARVDLLLLPAAAAAQAMEFADQPNFTVAGVTDWTAVGGHGSDVSLRTSEDLARETLTLQASRDSLAPALQTQQRQEQSRLQAELARDPRSVEIHRQLGRSYLASGLCKEAIDPLLVVYDAEPANDANEYDLARAYQGAGEGEKAREHVRNLLARKETAELHSLLGQLDEQAGDSLAAVQEDESAVRMEPSEPHYFAWGSELLLHRAIRQAVTVFREGASAYPRSSRLMAGLGAALFASASYAQAASALCAASDLDPAAGQPYLFLGKVEAAAPSPLPCVEEKLARFTRLEPDNASANYLYAMTLWKRQEVAGASKDTLITQQVEALLTKATSSSSECAEAYLQLGILAADRHDYRKAAADYLKAIEEKPQLSEAHYRLGVAYDRLGEREKARTEFQAHAAIEKQQAVEVEHQRQQVKQFQVVTGTPSAATP